MRSIPSPTYVDGILWGKVIDDKAFNVRLQIDGGYDAYSVDNNRELYTSLKHDGLIKRDPMAFSRSPNGTCKVLAGHLRTAMMRAIREEEIARRAANGEPESPDTLPFATIHGLVYDGLSLEQETLIMADHVMRKDLTEPERAKEIGEFLRRFPVSEVKASIHFGLEKSKLQRLKMRYLMPTVYAEFIKERDRAYKGAYYKVDQKTLTALYSAFLIDQAAGNGWREEGPAFRAAWSKFVADNDIFKGTAAKADDPRKDADTCDGMITAIVTTHGDNPEILAIRDTIRWASGRPDDDGQPVNLNRVIETIAEYCDGLRAKAAPAPAPADAPADAPKKTTRKMKAK